MQWSGGKLKQRLRATFMSDRASTWALVTWTTLTFLFLYLPLAVLVIFSFASNSVSVLPLHHFTLEWYRQAFANTAVLVAARNSLFVALGAVAIATVIGVPGAILVDRHNFPGRRIFQKFVLLPLILPGVITGVAFQTFFQMLGIERSLITVTLAHGTALVSTVLTTVYARLLRLERSPEHASADLGVGPLRTFFYVTLPSIQTAIIAAGLLAFTLSFDEIPVTIFTIGASNTLPMYIWSSLRTGAQVPQLNAIATMMAVAGGIVVVVFARLISRDDRKT
jgi:spermidine/putrescine transport system permease protein